MSQVFFEGKVASSDDASLSYLRLGDGPPLVVVHGSFSTKHDWLPFAREMAETHCVFLYDRRGRGESRSAGSDFAVDAEVDDLAAMMALAGPGAALLGHSFGGGCALAFAAREGFAGPLIVYEPRHSAHEQMSRGLVPEIARLIASGDVNAALHFVMARMIGLPEPAIAAFRDSPQWAPMLATLPALPNELRFLDSLAWRPGDLDTIAGTPWLLVGAESDALPADAALQTVLPALRKRPIPGQKHFAYVAAPALLADIVRECVATG